MYWYGLQKQSRKRDWVAQNLTSTFKKTAVDEGIFYHGGVCNFVTMYISLLRDHMIKKLFCKVAIQTAKRNRDDIIMSKIEDE